MVLGEPSQGFAVWDGHGRRGAISSSADVHAPSQEDRSAGCFLFGLQQVLGFGPPASHRFGRGRGRPERGFNPRRRGPRGPLAPIGGSFRADVSYLGVGIALRIFLRRPLAQPCPDGSTRVAPGHL